MLRKQMLALLLASIVLAGCARKADEGSRAPSQPTPSANEMKDVDGRTILMRTAETGEVDRVQKLIDEGADVNSQSNSGVTALMTAAGMGHAGVTRLLIEKGADVNAKTPGNYTALMNAALTGQAETVRILLDAGADTTTKDASGKTAKDYALMKEHKNIAAMIDEQASAGGSKK
ncbi:MAG TPA: ankyrin repeat domain-containing protein [Blastocatellia bacterium]|jgi:ankyrin repeat protein|nr:ankyrin repeat domain-containing protein [Blastocatellia bacterium]